MKGKRWRKRRGQWDPLSGGIRIPDKLDALIEVTEDCTVIWGLHNTVCTTTRYKKGAQFYTLGGLVGSWHDILPDWYRPDKTYWKEVQKTGLSGDQIENRNKKLGLFINEERHKIGY